MQTFAETNGFAKNQNEEYYMSQSSKFEVIHGRPSSSTSLTEGNQLNLRKALFQSVYQPTNQVSIMENSECKILNIQKQINQLSERNTCENSFEDGSTGNFSIKMESKIDLIVKSLIALQQVETISMIIDEKDNNGYKQTVRTLLSRNKSHLTYMVNYFQKSEKIIHQINEIIALNNVQILIYG